MNALECLERDGFGWARGVVDGAEVESWIEYLGRVEGAGSRGWSQDGRVRAWSESTSVRGLYEPVLGVGGRLVRAIYFVKTPESNWGVSWHQDLSIAVKRRVELDGYGPWSLKEGVWHVQPPVEILEGMLTLRLHLDAADEAKGCLKVVPGSHRRGKLEASEMVGERERLGEVHCVAGVGDVLLMRPLLLHASGKMSVQGWGGEGEGWRHRRVLHLEFAGMDLGGGLDWF